MYPFRPVTPKPRRVKATDNNIWAAWVPYSKPGVPPPAKARPALTLTAWSYHPIDDGETERPRRQNNLLQVRSARKWLRPDLIPGLSAQS